MKKYAKFLLVGCFALCIGFSVTAVNRANNWLEAKAVTADIGSFNIVRGTQGVDYTISNNTIITNDSSDLLLESTVDVFKTGHIKFDNYKFPVAPDGASAGVSIIFNATVNGEGKITGDVIRPYINSHYGDKPAYQCQGWVINDVYGTSNDEWSDHAGFGDYRDFEHWWNPALGGSTMAGWRARSFFNGWDGNKVFIHVKNAACEITNPTVEDTNDAIFNRVYRHQWGLAMLRQRTTCFNNGANHGFTMHLQDSVNLADIDHLYLTKYAPHGRQTDLAEVTVNGGSATEWEIKDSLSGYGNFDLEIDKSAIDADRNYTFNIHNINGEYAVSTYGLIYDIDGTLYAADRLVCGHGLSETAHNYYEDSAGFRGTQEWAITPGQGYKLIGRPGDVVEIIDYPSITPITNNLVLNYTSPTAYNFLDNVDIVRNGCDYRNELWLDFGNGSFKVTDEHGDAFSYLFTDSTSGNWYVDIFMANPDNSGVYKHTVSGSFVVTITASDDAVAWAQSFNAKIGAACNAQGNTDVENDLAPAWATVKSEYDALSAAAKEALLTSTDEDVVDALEKYDYIVAKYDSLNDFLNRRVPSNSALIKPLLANTSTVICVVSGLIVVCAGIAFAVISIRKRKTRWF